MTYPDDVLQAAREVVLKLVPEFDRLEVRDGISDQQVEIRIAAEAMAVERRRCADEAEAEARFHECRIEAMKSPRMKGVLAQRGQVARRIKRSILNLGLNEPDPTDTSHELYRRREPGNAKP